MIKDSVAYVLARIEDDSSLTTISQHESMVEGLAAGGHRVEVEDHNHAYTLISSSGSRVATLCEGRIGYREWARRRLHSQPRSEDEYIHALDDRYDQDVNELLTS